MLDPHLEQMILDAGIDEENGNNIQNVRIKKNHPTVKFKKVYNKSKTKEHNFLRVQKEMKVINHSQRNSSLDKDDKD